VLCAMKTIGGVEV